MKIRMPCIIACCFMFVILSGCSSKELPPPKWQFQPSAITISLESDPRLNLYDNTPHTLFMCVFQLTDPNAFNLYTQDTSGISELLACKRFDSTVVGFKKIILQPGTTQKMVLDRAEGARYVGLVAGYYTLGKDTAVRLYKIPVVEKAAGLLKRTRFKAPGKLSVGLYLGPTGIIENRGVQSGK